MNDDYVEQIHSRSEDEKLLLELLWRLNFQENDRATCFRDIESFFLKKAPQLRKEVVSKPRYL